VKHHSDTQVENVLARCRLMDDSAVSDDTLRAITRWCGVILASAPDPSPAAVSADPLVRLAYATFDQAWVLLCEREGGEVSDWEARRRAEVRDEWRSARNAVLEGLDSERLA
jgi:hypothetical protein